ncbi:RNA-binding S4 domain-containing protein [Maricaulaceae bacterium NA33B04]|nr:RNA-binding S4 domain-containing protein [Maricaulaceae bacterium NA33B04]
MSDEAQRCDIWLFRARLFKSRALATAFIESGKMRINRTGRVERLKKPSGLVRPGDRLIYTRDQRLMTIEILALGDRRGPASEAQTLYRLADETED